MDYEGIVIKRTEIDSMTTISATKLIGNDDGGAIEETLFLMSIPGMAQSIINSGNTPLEDCLSEDEVEI